ncbi:SIS domain-containing protein [Anaerolentibacter hominis]|uniref:SIS domain-containing protein n=1 Tax=Anaerolentibacter hominis TaxID=3079009 RepID=UPI0031B804A3
MFTEILKEVKNCYMNSSDGQIDRTLREIKRAKRIVIHGKGRMGLILKAFGMHLSGYGYDVRTVGDVTAPAIGPGDFFLAASASGYPSASTRFFEIAREKGALSCAITAYRSGPVGMLADCFLEIHARTMNLDQNDVPSLQPMCSTLEQTELFILDYIAWLAGNKLENTRENKEWYIDRVIYNAGQTDRKECTRLGAWIHGRKRLFFYAGRRELMILSAFAMRIYHMGFLTYVMNEVTVPEIQSGDGIVTACRNEDQKTLLQMEEAGRKGLVLALTGNITERIKNKAQAVIKLPECEDDVAYTQTMLLFLDYTVAEMMKRYHMEEADLAVRHTNME